jgi:hypothetical protein
MESVNQINIVMIRLHRAIKRPPQNIMVVWSLVFVLLCPKFKKKFDWKNILMELFKNVPHTIEEMKNFDF